MYSELIKEDDLVDNLTKEYTYDNYGNILSKKTYTYNTTNLIKEDTYEYGDSGWQDLLTKFNNETITYDEIGNPLSIGNETLTWMNGRELATYSSGANNISYKYNADGIRTSKKINSWQIDYYLEGNKIIFEDAKGYMLYYIYNGDELLGFVYKNKTYYYHKNISGDIIGILDSNYNEVVKYVYDSWGVVLDIIDETDFNLGMKNPFRYRSYYYDEETELYYLNYRYYNPKIGRFINSDGIINANNDIISFNLFNYTSNNYNNYTDYNGCNAEALPWNNLKDLVGAIASGASALVAGAAAVVSSPAVVGAALVAGTAVAIGMTAGYSKDNNSNEDKKVKHSVYALVDEDNIVRYIGRTIDLITRADAHRRNPYRNGLHMYEIKGGLGYFEARGVEQNMIEYCNVLNKDDKMYNQINGIRPGTDNYQTFTKMGGLLFDHHIVPTVGDKCYIDPSAYRLVS